MRSDFKKKLRKLSENCPDEEVRQILGTPNSILIVEDEGLSEQIWTYENINRLPVYWDKTELRLCYGRLDLQLCILQGKLSHSWFKRTRISSQIGAESDTTGNIKTDS